MPFIQEKEETLSFVQIGMEILRVARNELYLNYAFSGCGAFKAAFCAGWTDPQTWNGRKQSLFSAGRRCGIVSKGTAGDQPGLSAQYRTLSVLPPLESEEPGCGILESCV